MNKPILCLDFDGVCHSYSSGWKGAACIPDPPVDGMFMFLWEALPHFEIHIFSSRSNQEGGIEAMRNWFASHAQGTTDFEVVKELRFPTVKPPAVIGIDDRVLTFDGKWPAVDVLRSFQPWNKKASV